MKVKIVSIESRQVFPSVYDKFDGWHYASGKQKVPVLDIYGIEDGSGRKIVSHVHQIYPYLYIPYYEYEDSILSDGGNYQQNQSDNNNDQQRRRLGDYMAVLEEAINLALSLKNNGRAEVSYVRAIVPVKGIDMYGYHARYKLYLKIYLNDPRSVNQLSDLLCSGAIMNRFIQPYESHFPFDLQFMMDYNLFGMDYMQLNEEYILIRTPHDQPQLLCYEESVMGRESSADIELDIYPWTIMNRAEVKERAAQPFHPITDRKEKLVHSLQCLWLDEQRRRDGEMPKQEVDLNDRSLPTKIDYKDRVLNAVKQFVDSAHTNDRTQSDDQSAAQSAYMTSFQSVTALYPAHVLVRRKSDQSASTKTSQTDVHNQVHTEGDNSDDMILDQLTDEPIRSYATAIPSTLRGLKIDATQYVNESIIQSQRVQSPNQMVDNDIVAGILGDDDDHYDNDGGDQVFENLQKQQQQFDNGIADDSLENEHESSDSELDDLLAWMAQKKASQDDIYASNIESNLLSQQNVHRDDTINQVNMESSNFISNLDAMWSPQKVGRQIEHWSDKPMVHSPSQKLKSQCTGIEPVEGTQAELSQPSHHFTQLSPPSYEQVLAEVKSCVIPVQYRDPFYSQVKDVGKKARQFGGALFKVGGPDAAVGGERFQSVLPHVVWSLSDRQSKYFTPVMRPPSYQQVQRELSLQRQHQQQMLLHNQSSPTTIINDKGDTKGKNRVDISQIDGPTMIMAGRDFKLASASVQENRNSECDLVTVMSLELHASVHDKERKPDPSRDPIQCMMLTVQDSKFKVNSDNDNEDDNDMRDDFIGGVNGNQNDPDSGFGYKRIVMMIKDEGLRQLPLTEHILILVADELQMINCLIQLVRDYDPEIILGYEIHMSSWGYAAERAYSQYKIDLCKMISRSFADHRINTRGHGGINSDENNEHRNEGLNMKANEWGYQKASGLKVTGRIVLNAWRLFRAEMALTSYTYQTMMYHVLHRRVPKFSPFSLSRWYWGRDGLDRYRVVQYYSDMSLNTLKMLDECNILIRTAEFAKVFGVQFYAVISRGSQFKVESMMARIAKPENYLLISPSRQQVRQMRALECLPLVMEPESAFYKCPLVVLDFQSLYPSIMIAYNYCFSTCLGKCTPQHLDTLGFADYKVDPQQLRQMMPVESEQGFAQQLNASPNGVAFLKATRRDGILKKMLSEVLDTRIMIKDSMKLYKNRKALTRILDARQLGLKYIANVTYGYTSASFSGRMPCVDVSDSIVQMGRETLERAIRQVNEHPQWNARVVYADTDSMFIYMDGSSRERAFSVGREIADTITRQNPYPMKLKFEKVYHPSVLLSKKRYVGWKFESEQSVEGEFDAKGIETVRRDGCPAVAKIMESSLKILFRSQDMSELKRYLQMQWQKIQSGRVSLQDFVIAKEVKLGTYSENGIGPPGAVLSVDKMARDRRDEPQYGERVPYLVRYLSKDARLVDCVISPEDFMRDPGGCRLNAEYYITKQIIPALARVFDLIGCDIMSWYTEMPKVGKIIKYSVDQLLPFDYNVVQKAAATNHKAVNTLEKFYQSQHCYACGKSTGSKQQQQSMQRQKQQLLCQECLQRPDITAMNLNSKASVAESKYLALVKVCQNCCAHQGVDAATSCESIECPVFYERLKSLQNFSQIPQLMNALQLL
ncbi:hypothetical protein MP228_005646 [Amoeboaphelidium protococcarum]|nr:hypothetical protein MP228_005646 [Amoeboaphelidium protococcarum]